MTFKDIEKKANNFKGQTNISPTNLEENIIELLKICLKENIKIELTEKDFVKIINIYYNLYHVYYDDFLKQLKNQSPNSINLSKVLNILTK